MDQWVCMGQVLGGLGGEIGGCSSPMSSSERCVRKVMGFGCVEAKGGWNWGMGMDHCLAKAEGRFGMVE